MLNQATSSMPEEDHAYFHKLIFLLEQVAEPKFEAGVVEHGNHIWELSDEQLEMEELNEMVDLLIYRLTRLQKRRNAGAQTDSGKTSA